MSEGTGTETMRRDIALQGQSIETLEKGNIHVWDAINDLKKSIKELSETLTSHRIQTALIQGGAVVVNALVMYLVTRGIK